MGVWQGVTMNSLKFYPGPPCCTSLRPAGRRPLKSHGHFRGGPPAGRAAYGRLLPYWKPHAVRLCLPPSDANAYMSSATFSQTWGKTLQKETEKNTTKSLVELAKKAGSYDRDELQLEVRMDGILREESPDEEEPLDTPLLHGAGYVKVEAIAY
jgi:hypothetical protein